MGWGIHSQVLVHRVHGRLIPVCWKGPQVKDVRRSLWSFLPLQELERLEVERVEMIRQHLCQYTQLRHETDMFNQSVSSILLQ